MANSSDIFLNENQRWYVRAAVIRGIQALESDIEKGEEYLSGEGIPATFREAIKGMIAYNTQMLEEMKQYIPEVLQPR